MPTARFAISVFKELPGTVEIVALGPVRRQLGTAVEAGIEVLLATKLDEPDFEPETDVFRTWVGCGQIDLLTVGSRWEGGRRCGEVEASRYSGAFTLSMLEELGVGHGDVVGGCRRVPSRLFHEAPCWLLNRAPPRGSKRRGPEKVLLPHVELVRALFGVSSGFLVQLIDGVRHPSVPDRGMLDRKRSGVTPTGTVRLGCWRRPTEEEALILAAMVADPEIMRFHDQVFQYLSVQKSYRDDRRTWPVARWPFRGPIGLTLEGRWFVRENGRRRFLATRITEVALELPFRHIEVHYVGAGDDEPPDRLPPRIGRMRATNARLVVLTSGRAPSRSRRPALLVSAPVAVPQSEGVTIEYVAYRDGYRLPISSIGEDPRDEGDFSTAGRERGGDPSRGRAEVRRGLGGDSKAAQSEREEVLTWTWRAILAAAKGRWQCTPYPVAAGVLVSHNGGFDFRREGILAGLNVGGRLVIVADDGSAEGDRRSLGLLVPRMGNVTRRELQAIRAIDDIYGGRWGSAAIRLAGFDIYPVRRHPKVRKDQAAYAELLRRKIEAAVSGI